MAINKYLMLRKSLSLSKVQTKIIFYNIWQQTNILMLEKSLSLSKVHTTVFFILDHTFKLFPKVKKNICIILIIIIIMCFL